jgi:acylphosphatase
MAEKELACLHAIVEGYVQGVGFRAFVQQTADALKLTGWVRNRWDGDVEVFAEGERHVLGQLLIALQRGPRASNVLGVKQEWGEYTGECTDFSVRRTA